MDVSSTPSKIKSDIQKHLHTRHGTSHPPIDGSVMYFTSLGKYSQVSYTAKIRKKAWLLNKQYINYAWTTKISSGHEG